jgi:hypothetical protein
VSAQAVPSSERADACLAALDAEGRAIARRVCLRLIRFGDAGPRAGQQQLVTALRAGDDAGQVAATVRQLTDAGLLAVHGDAASDDARVELADAALVDAWPALQAWLRSHGKPEQLRRQLEDDAAAWSQRADGTRLLGKRQLGELSAALPPDVRLELGVTATAESFITASRAAARRRWLPEPATTGPVLAILVTLVILATPIILLFVVVLSAWMIHRFQ